MSLLSIGLALAVALSMAFADDAEAKKKKKRAQFNPVRCFPDLVCTGTDLNEFLLGAEGNENIRGLEGNDIYTGNEGDHDLYTDTSPNSNDTYAGFPDQEFDYEIISDSGGNDTIVLTNFSSNDFEVSVWDRDNDGAEDDLVLDEISGDADEDLYVLNHFAPGSINKVETVRFSNGPVNLGGLTLSSLAKGASVSGGAGDADDQEDLQRANDEQKVSSSADS